MRQNAGRLVADALPILCSLIGLVVWVSVSSVISGAIFGWVKEGYRIDEHLGAVSPTTLAVLVLVGVGLGLLAFREVTWQYALVFGTLLMAIVAAIMTISVATAELSFAASSKWAGVALVLGPILSELAVALWLVSWLNNVLGRKEKYAVRAMQAFSGLIIGKLAVILAVRGLLIHS